MNSKNKGNYAEALFITRCLEKGYTVALAYGDNAPYDCIIDMGKRLVKVQVKGRFSTKNKSILHIPFISSINNISKEAYSYADKVDWIVGVDLDDKKIYVLETKDFELSQTGVNLRKIPTKNQQLKGIRLASDYEF